MYATMELKQAIRVFHYGEQVKTLLINASNLTLELEKLEENEREAGIKIYKGVLEQVRGEIKMAGYLAELPPFQLVDSKVKEAIWEVHIRRPEEVCRILGEAISLTVSLTLDAAKELKEKDLL
ncbi:MAG: hypothetical protein U1D96_06030 [Eubacteriales bacterium]|nr:hypothetical protein [Bacillota bacterium]MBV1726826.1 hypothetical protein [Desulforudis sp.]MDP3050961.1 hypothetical protein [Eubacteriales bacterium]MBU4554841.1 hypothetical protein [Bacillota bacterium]MBV1734923.1 hypothetical protein [Desulforudis sp.]